MRPTHVVGRIANTLRSDGHAHGMVTAELAMAIPALGLVVTMLTSVVGAASDLAKASDAARSAARAASIGTGYDEVVSAAARVAPEGADIDVLVERGWAHVEIAVPPLRWGPVQIPLPTITGAAPVEPDLAGASR
ncbi:MAG: TadE family type IV pilus minor pilin [Actinomycetes bacterium]